MPFFEQQDTKIYYEESGSGFPVLLFAAGGMRSEIRFWEGPPFNPIEFLSPHFRVIAMDQRNAGQSTAPISGEDGWHSYTADHLALLDHLQVDRCHLLGGCIGGPYCFGVMQAAPDRVAAAVLQQTIGFSDNKQACYEMFDGWAADLKKSRPEIDEATWSSFRGNMYDGDFVFNVSRDFVRSCATPLLVLMGTDLYHPEVISREVADLAPNAQLVEQWKEPERVDGTVDMIVEFLKSHTPA
ncbi:MAG: alpha/beta hydrolase [Pseudomonadales bacterium]|jgi:pimeloyl-ACP methyl ester carboxylesterase|nr:alpha/beta hydrolase [Pseudomonadales bacterium]HJN51995.1 alpha/beta hydrolase [Pseudomonadales bacterium]